MWFDKIQPFSKIKIYFVFVVKYIGDNVHNSITKNDFNRKVYCFASPAILYGKEREALAQKLDNTQCTMWRIVRYLI